MTTLYKYLSSRAAGEFCQGRIRIGTLYEYREVERFGSQIGDSDEGIRIDWSWDRARKSGAALNEVEQIAMHVPATMVVENNYTRVRVISPDYYLLCFSRDRNRQIARRLGRDAGRTYDSCVEIVDVQGLLEQVCSALAEEAAYEGLYRCVYQSRWREHREPEIHPAVLKDPSYSYQAEVRAIWRSLCGSPRHRCVKIEDPMRYCRLIPEGEW